MATKFEQQWNRFFEITGCRSCRDLSLFLECEQSTVGKAKRRMQNLPPAWLLHAVLVRRINPGWVLHGTGSRFLLDSAQPGVDVRQLRTEDLIRELYRRFSKPPSR